MNLAQSLFAQLRASFPAAIEKGGKLLGKLVEVIGLCPKCGSVLCKFELSNETKIGTYEYQCGAKLETDGGPLSDKRSWAKRCPHERVKDFDRDDRVE